VLGSAVGCASAQSQESTASRAYELFVCAIRNLSTSPAYVLITVVDGRSGSAQQVAIASNALRSAIRAEYDIPVVDVSNAIEIALASPDRSFTFYRDAALAAVRPHYTPDLLADIRTRLEGLANDELIEMLDVKLGPCGEIIEHPLLIDLYSAHEDDYRGCNDAIAHVLLEHQIPCSGGGCFGGGVSADTYSRARR